MYIPRNIDRELEMWKNSANRKPLILRGVRQCGKTKAVRHLGEGFRHYVEINLEKKTKLHRLFEGDINVSALLARLELESGEEIVEGETLLFLDEIQECPRAITALRYFFEERPKLHIIAVGSLLEFTLGRRKQGKFQFPVGRVRSIFLYPFSYVEYLTAIGQQKMRDMLEDPAALEKENIAHDRFLEYYKQFLIIGGMPEAVSTFVETNSFLASQRVHRDIIMNFKEDFDKCDSNVPAENLRLVFEYSLHHACDQVRAANAVKGMSAYNFNNALDLLRRAGLVLPVNASSCETLPLGSGEKGENRKILPFDTGVYLTELGMNASEILDADVFEDLNKGDLAELATGLEFNKATDPYREAHLYYWYRSGANAEVDYVIQRQNEIIPVEVKASVKGGMKSMQQFLSWRGSTYGIRVSMEDFARYNNVHVVPIYAAGSLVR